MRAIILAGGRGSRLEPLTQHLPKPLVPFFGRPLIEHQIEWLVRYGITDIIVSLGHFGSVIERTLNSQCRGANLRYVKEEQPLGTAGAIAWALEQYPTTEPVLVIPGDCLTDFRLDHLIAALLERRSAVMGIALHRVDDARQFGVVDQDAHGRVTRIIEKPAVIEGPQLVNTGIYLIMKPDAIDWGSTRPLDFAYDVFPTLIAKGQLTSVGAEGYWSDLGTLNQYRESHFDVMQGRLSNAFPVQPASDEDAGGAIGPVWLGEGVTIDAQAKVGPNVVIGAGSYVGPWSRLQNVVIGENVFLGPGTRLEEAIVADSVAIGGRCRIGRQVAIGKDSRIGWGVSISNGTRISIGSRLAPAPRRPALVEMVSS